MLRSLIVLACLALGAPTAIAAGPGDLKAAIEAQNAKFVAAFARGDGAAIAALYTEDATVLPPGAPAVKGRAAIRDFWQGAAQQLGDARLVAVDVKPLGRGTAREIGTFSLKQKSDGATIAGKYVVVWEKVGNAWKLATDIWNAGQ